MGATRVMIVEDNTTVAKDLSGCLFDLGYEVTSIEASGEEAVEKAGADHPDIVLMDIHLRDKMRGIEAAELIHGRYGTPVVFLSAYSDRKLLEKAKRVGAFGYLVKPFEERELFAMVEMAIYKAKAEQERRELEVQLAQMQKREGLQVMAASIAHNFNNILQVPLGYYELMLEALPPTSGCREHIEISQKAVERAAGISQLMLVYVGHGQKKMGNICLDRGVQEVTAEFKDGLCDQQELKLDYNCGSALINADFDQIKDLITALLTNATEAIGSGSGEIRITTRIASSKDPAISQVLAAEMAVPTDYVLMEVSDTGCGMDTDTLAKLYDPFFTTKFAGRGLGLAMVQGIVQGHHGAIAVQSEPGQGTVFKIVFPISVGTDLIQ